MDRDQTLYAYNGVKHTIDAVTGASATHTTAISNHCTVLRLVAAEDVYVTFETLLDASATIGLLVKAGVIEYFKVSGGQKLNALAVTTDGALEICEMTS